MAIVPGPQEFLMGSADDEPGRVLEDERRHRRRIGRTFAMATREVTLEQFKRFIAEHPDVAYRPDPTYGPEPDGPAYQLTWFQAARYCRWLSEREQIPEPEMCYPRIADIKPGMKLPADFLRRTGYRLPTEAEWECACRAGTTTSRPYGEGTSLLPSYARYGANSDGRSWPVGRLKPNDWGFFDMLGNVEEWCQDSPDDYPDPPAGRAAEDDLAAEREPVAEGEGESSLRITRGGAFAYQDPRFLRSAYREWYEPLLRNTAFGFRVARTMK
jgi:formylglycine-generating enzyme required for sulfatase activity